MKKIIKTVAVLFLLAFASINASAQTTQEIKGRSIPENSIERTGVVLSSGSGNGILSSTTGEILQFENPSGIKVGTGDIVIFISTVISNTPQGAKIINILKEVKL